MTIEHCCICDEATGNAGHDEDSIFIIRNNIETGPFCESCSSDYNCTQCGELAIELHEGYCEDCCNKNQTALDAHNSQYDYWNNASEKERDEMIKNRCA